MSTIGLRIMRRIVYTSGKPCQVVLTELGDDRAILSFHSDTGNDEDIGTQQIAVVMDRRQFVEFVNDAGALFHHAEDK